MSRIHHVTMDDLSVDTVQSSVQEKYHSRNRKVGKSNRGIQGFCEESCVEVVIMMQITTEDIDYMMMKLALEKRSMFDGRIRPKIWKAQAQFRADLASPVREAVTPLALSKPWLSILIPGSMPRLVPLDFKSLYIRLPSAQLCSPTKK
ncbi:hypothetical protein RRG08_035086 [Elysia crispata]|uniref:Uncharacterized protein n=1 Tax=Elysia crispata TaxID=231223 RepID=A0AAE1DL10_9GAST|nr:hypothetical protein RRG08_035086 [Elysia crispata]